MLTVSTATKHYRSVVIVDCACIAIPWVLIGVETFNRTLTIQVTTVTISNAAEVFTPESRAELQSAVDACTQGLNQPNSGNIKSGLVK